MNEQAGEAVAANSEAASATTLDRETRIQPQAREEQPESRTHGILREAIHKVMAEIEHHEREAKDHLRQAETLRKDLRESVAFLLEQGKVKQIAGFGTSRAGKAAEANAHEDERETPASKRRRGRPRKK